MVLESKISKGGVNVTFQFNERPPPPAPIKPARDQDAENAIRHFCSRCLADDQGGSWGEGTIGGGCMNCGASGFVVPLPAWAVKSIREQASWVGKRYYPHEEDRQTYAELVYLRSQMPIPTGRTAKPMETDGVVTPGRWWVTQEEANGGRIMTTVTATSLEEALRKSLPVLPYPVPA